MKIKNNKLRQILFLAVTISANICFSQAYTILPGEERVYNKEEGVIFKGYLESDSKTFLYENKAISDKPGEYEMINRLDINSLNKPSKIANFNLDLTKRDILSEVELQRAIFNEKAYVVTSVFQLDENKKYVYIRKVDFNKSASANGKATLLSVNCDKKNFNDHNFKVIFSPDKSKLLVLHILYKSYNSIEITAHTFDVNSLEKISETPLKYNVKGEDLNFGNFLLSNNGDIICTPVKVSIVYVALNAPNVDYTSYPVLFMFKAKEAIPQIIDFPKECSENPSYKLQIENENIFVYGICFNSKKTRNEIFFAKFDVQAEKFVVSNTISPASKITDKLKETIGSHITIDKLVVKNNDVFVFCHNTFTMQYTTQYGSYTQTFNKELLISKFDLQADNKNMYLMPKYTHFNLKYYHVYANNNALYMIYAEHPKNLEESTLENYDGSKYHKIENYNGSVTVCTKIDQNGKMTREKLFENKGWCFKPENLDIVIEKENALILHMIKGKKERFDKLILK